MFNNQADNTILDVSTCTNQKQATEVTSRRIIPTPPLSWPKRSKFPPALVLGASLAHIDVFQTYGFNECICLKCPNEVLSMSEGRFVAQWACTDWGETTSSRHFLVRWYLVYWSAEVRTQDALMTGEGSYLQAAAVSVLPQVLNWTAA